MEYKLAFVPILYFKFAQFLRQIQFDSAGDFLLLNHDFGFPGLAIDKLLCQSSVLLLNQIRIETLYGIAVSAQNDTCLLRVNWFYFSLINISLFKVFKNEYLCHCFTQSLSLLRIDLQISETILLLSCLFHSTTYAFTNASPTLTSNFTVSQQASLLDLERGWEGDGSAALFRSIITVPGIRVQVLIISTLLAAADCLSRSTPEEASTAELSMRCTNRVTDSNADGCDSPGLFFSFSSSPSSTTKGKLGNFLHKSPQPRWDIPTFLYDIDSA